MYRCPCASRVPIHRSMCIDAHTCIRIRKRACVYVHVHVHQCICASIPMCLRGCLRARVCGVRIYRCTFVRINTHRHTRTYPGGNTHPCVCVCVCLSVRPTKQLHWPLAFVSFPRISYFMYLAVLFPSQETAARMRAGSAFFSAASSDLEQCLQTGSLNQSFVEWMNSCPYSTL